MKLNIFIFLLFVLLNTNNAQDEIQESDYALKGVKKIQLTISISPQPVPLIGLTENEIYSHASYLLRRDGLEVFSKATKNVPTLNIFFMVFEKGTNNYELAILTSLNQDVTIISNKKKVEACTWRAVSLVGNLGMENASELREVVERICRDFVNALLTVNPR
jgi:hypothetical protein